MNVAPKNTETKQKDFKRSSKAKKEAVWRKTNLMELLHCVCVCGGADLIIMCITVLKVSCYKSINVFDRR